MKARSFTTSKQKEHGQQQAQGGSSSLGQTQEQLTSSNTVAAMIEAVPRGEDIPKDILASTSKTSVMEWETQSTNTVGSKGAERSAMLENGSPCAEARAVSSGRPKEFSDGNIEEGGDTETSHLVAVAVCVAGAVMSSMLQFAFVYGKRTRFDVKQGYIYGVRRTAFRVVRIPVGSVFATFLFESRPSQLYYRNGYSTPKHLFLRWVVFPVRIKTSPVYGHDLSRLRSRARQFSDQ